MAGFKMLRKRTAHRAKIFLKYCFSKKVNDPVFLITTRRSGSNYLLGLLNSVPGVSFASEVLHPGMYYGLRERLITKNAALRHIRHSLNACEHRLCGAKLLFLHLDRHQLTPEDLIKHFPRARFIVLYRRSLIDQFVSLKTAERTHVWQTTEDPAPKASMHVDPWEWRNFCLDTRAKYQALLRNPWLRGRTLVLDYETLSAHPQRVFDRTVLPWLGLPPSPVSSPFRKQNTASPAERVQNYSDILHFAGESWAWQDYSSEPAPAEMVSR